MRRWAFGLVLLLGTLNVRAGSERAINLSKDAEAKIVVRSCFDRLPPGGYAPLEIKIDNAAASARTWRFQFTSPSYSYRGDSMTDGAEFTVPGRNARNFKVLAPLVMGEANSHAPLTVRAFGPGAEAGSQAIFTYNSATKGDPSPFIAMSERLATRSWSQLEGELKSGNVALRGARFVASELPEDWRAYIGIAGIWLSNNEASQLSPGQRGGLHDWVLRGGTLFLCGDAHVPSDFATAGFGEVIPFAKETIDLAATAASINLLAPGLVRQVADDYSGIWPARQKVGEIATNVPLLIGFMGLFAIAIGPVNLFVLGGRGRRHRLFWTTPLISLGASLILWALIILQDGFGGHGARFALVRLLPSEKKIVVLQEQLARTGVLLHSDFETREPGLVASLDLDTASDAPRAQLRNSGARYAGEWFRSRSLQAHWLESVSSSRAEITLLNADEMRAQKSPPIILSTVSAPLSDLYYCDEQKRFWHAKTVRTGERTTLESVAEMPRLLSAEAGPRLRTLWEQAKNQPGNFYATSMDASDLIATLPSIRWEASNVVYLGAITTAPAP